MTHDANLSQHQNSHENESALFITVPADIVYDVSLSSEALRVYLIISGFFRKSGYAFAGNEWIAKKTGFDERTVQRYLQELESKGYLYREVFNQGLKRHRKIWHPDAWAKKNSKNVAESVSRDVMEDVRPDVIDYVRPDVYNSISNTNNLNTPSPSSFANAHYEGSSPRGKKHTPTAKPMKKKHGQFVELSEKEYQDLVEKYGPKVVEYYIETINDWIPNNKPYKDYAAAIRTWAKRDEMAGKQILDKEYLENCKTDKGNIIRRTNEVLSRQNRIPTYLEVKDLKVYVVCNAKGVNDSISLCKPKEEFKELLKQKLESLGFDLSQPDFLPKGDLNVCSKK